MTTITGQVAVAATATDTQPRLLNATITTGAAARMRAHLLSKHHDVNGLTVADDELHRLHREHHTAGAGHAVTGRSWDEATCRETVSDVPADAGRDALDNALGGVLLVLDDLGATGSRS